MPMEGVTATAEYRRDYGSSIFFLFKNQPPSPRLIVSLHVSHPPTSHYSPLYCFLHLTFLCLDFPLIVLPSPLSQSFSPSSLSNPACLINFLSHGSSLQHSVCHSQGVGGGIIICTPLLSDFSKYKALLTVNNTSDYCSRRCGGGSASSTLAILSVYKRRKKNIL